MTKTVLLGLTLAAVLTMAIAFPTVADAITGIKKTEIKDNDDKIKKLKFHLENKVPKTPFAGYAIFTENGDVVAITSHAQFFDSTGQQAPTASQIALQVGGIAAVCTVSDVACGDEWHTHLVKPNFESTICDVAQIEELSYNEPSTKVNAAGKHVLARNIDLGDQGLVGALSGTLQDFTVGTPQQGGLAFDLVPVDANGDPIDPNVNLGDLAGVCIVPTTGE